MNKNNEINERITRMNQEIILLRDKIGDKDIFDKNGNLIFDAAVLQELRHKRDCLAYNHNEYKMMLTDEYEGI